MKDYLMLNKIRMTYNLIKIRLYDFFHPDMSYTIDSNTYNWIEKHNQSEKEIVYNKLINDSMFFTHLDNEPIIKTFVIPIGDLNKKDQERLLADLISDYKSEIEFNETDGEIFFISNKKEDLN